MSLSATFIFSGSLTLSNDFRFLELPSVGIRYFAFAFDLWLWLIFAIWFKRMILSGKTFLPCFLIDSVSLGDALVCIWTEPSIVCVGGRYVVFIISTINPPCHALYSTNRELSSYTALIRVWGLYINEKKSTHLVNQGGFFALWLSVASLFQRHHSNAIHQTFVKFELALHFWFSWFLFLLFLFLFNFHSSKHKNKLTKRQTTAQL